MRSIGGAHRCGDAPPPDTSKRRLKSRSNSWGPWHYGYTRSPPGAQGIAQFMSGTAASYGMSNPFDPAAAIDAQAHLMHDLLRQLGPSR